MIDAADSERTTQWMKDAFKLGNSLGMLATPSYLVASDAYVGIMSLAQKRDAIARASRVVPRSSRSGRRPPYEPLDNLFRRA